MFKKNTAVTGFPFTMVSATDGSAITTGTPVGYVTLDGGTQAAIADVTPVHEGNGQWTFDLTAGEMNGDVVGLLITHASAVNVHFTIKTDTKIVSELNDLSSAAVNAEVLDVLNTDTFAEPASVPAATASLVAKIGWLAALARNKITQTATTQTLRNDADGADIATSAVSDDGTTFTRAEWT